MSWDYNYWCWIKNYVGNEPKRGANLSGVALICHIAFAFGLLVYGFIPSCEQAEVIHVFELAPLPSSPAGPPHSPKPVVQKPVPKPTPPKPSRL